MNFSKILKLRDSQKILITLSFFFREPNLVDYLNGDSTISLLGFRNTEKHLQELFQYTDDKNIPQQML